MSWLANLAYCGAALLYLPVLIYQMVVQRRNRRGWREKLAGPATGRFPPAPAGRIWIHGVSLGEINAARGIIAGLEQRCPGATLAVSTTTDTGFARAGQLYGADRVFRYPLDFSWAVRRALDVVRPRLIVLVELEAWYNLIILAARRGVPVCIVNGRLTERSCRRFRRIGPLARSMFGRLTWVAAQDADIADRFASVGVPRERITVTGSVKWDTATIADRVDGQDELAAALAIDSHRPLWVCGSTGPGEEAVILDVYARLRERHADLQLAVIPRKPERFDEVARLIESRGFACTRRSACPDHTPRPPTAPVGGGRTTVFLGDTLGELRKLYALADVVFVGRSLVPLGGSDPMEVAALARPVVVGPHMENFAEPTRALAAAGGLRQAADSSELAAALTDLLADARSARAMGAAARAVVLANQGATVRTLDRLVELCGPLSS